VCSSDLSGERWCSLVRRLTSISAFILLWGLFCILEAKEVLAELTVRESVGIDRNLEYVEFELQLPLEEFSNDKLNILAIRKSDNLEIPCQITEFTSFKQQQISNVRIIFPVTLKAYQTDNYLIKSVDSAKKLKTDLLTSGDGFDKTIENDFYLADLSRSNQSEGKNHESGQLRELGLKLGFDVQLKRSENRMHWAPNFQNEQVEYYKTIAGWDRPETYEFKSGPYLVRSFRSDKAPEHDQILLSANYSFYAGLPYFKFYSSMEMTESLWLNLLRNDEMAMDSMFTHIAFERPNGEIIDVTFSEMPPN